jgi:hypothetical protein
MDRVKCFKFSVNYIENLNLVPTGTLLVVSIRDQLMFLYNEGQCVKTYVISTSKLPPSCVENSLGTPWGLHQISEIIGLGSPIGAVFKGRVDTGQVYHELRTEEQENNLITSRILRLKGMEPGVNQGGCVDTFSRYVYIHGTNHEPRLGEPSSSGCIQVSNVDAVELASIVPVSSFLLILKDEQIDDKVL